MFSGGAFNSVIVLWVALVLSSTSSNAETLRDPTRPLQYQAAGKQTPTLVLQAIYGKDNGYTAVINGQMVKTGERIEIFKVLRITDSRVYYDEHGATKVLTLRQNIFKED